MSKLKKTLQIRVGIFVAVGLACLFATVILLGSQKSLFGLTSKYKIRFSEVEGLFKGSVVSVNGLPAGYVKKIKFVSKTGEIHVLVAINKKFASVITEKSEAVLSTKGVLGDKFVSIVSYGEKSGTPLAEGSYISSQASSDLLHFLGEDNTKTQISSILKNLSETLMEMKVFTQSFNSENTIGKTTKAVENLTHFTSKQKAKDFSEILKSLKSILTKIDKGEGTVGALINNRNIYNRVLSLLGQKPYHQYLPSLVEDQAK